MKKQIPSPQVILGRDPESGFYISYYLTAAAGLDSRTGFPHKAQNAQRMVVAGSGPWSRLLPPR